MKLAIFTTFLLAVTAFMVALTGALHAQRDELDVLEQQIGNFPAQANECIHIGQELRSYLLTQHIQP